MATTIVEVYKKGGQWRWRMRDRRNGKTIGASTEAYKRRIDAIRNLQRVGDVGATAWPVVVTEANNTEEITL